MATTGTFTLCLLGSLIAAGLTSTANPMPSPSTPGLSLEVYGRPQKLVDIGGRRLNLFCLGRGSPTVILEGGLGASSIDWRKVHSELARTTRVCAYDRAGYGFSDPGPLPRDTAHLANDLAALTRAARLQPPYVLVGASLGGLIVRLYADTHLRDVGGMVLLDPEIEHDERRVPLDASRIANRKKRVEQMRACVAALEAGVPAPGSQVANDCVFDPDPQFPASVNARFAQVSSHPAYWKATLSEMVEAWGSGSDQVEASKRSYGDLPLIVLTARKSDTDHPPPDFVARGNLFSALHDEVAHLSTRGVNRDLQVTHQMMLSAPQVVIDAVNEVVAEVRKAKASPRPIH